MQMKKQFTEEVILFVSILTGGLYLFGENALFC